MNRQFAIGALLALAASASGCSDDGSDDPGTTAGTGGSAGTAAGSAGAAGTAGSAGAAGAAGSAGSVGAAGPGPTAGGELSFFVTSTGSGDAGGNLGGLEGADAKCQTLAAAVGAGNRAWRAYLSTAAENAVDRIGEGPWFNAEGVMVAADLASLHTAGLPREPVQLVLDETGAVVPGNQHDILTGSDAAGRLLIGTSGVAENCTDWTSNATEAPGPVVGHSDIPAPMFNPSWNSAHTPAGCSAAQLTMVGGAGRLYCFAE
jgi:hypothetical protein